MLLGCGAQPARACGAGSGPGRLLGALALVRPEYLGVALPPAAVVAGAGSALSGRRRPRRWRPPLPRAGHLRSSLPRGRSATRSPSTASCRSRPAAAQVALRRHLPAADGDPERAARRRCSTNARRCGERLEAEGPVDDPDRMVLERILERVAAEEPPGPGNRRRARPDGPREPRGRLTEEPLRFAGFLADKSYETWTDAARGGDARAALAGAAAGARRPRPRRPRDPALAAALRGAAVGLGPRSPSPRSRPC